MKHNKESLTIPKPEPRIEKFERLAYGMFIHWGLYSQLKRGEWVMNREAIDPKEYAKLKDTFTAADFDAPAIARLAKEAGMKYITLTTRHHEGFSLYDTKGLDNFDAPHSPAKRDLVAEFVDACRGEDIIPFFYHTTLDWRWDSAHCDENKFNEYLDYLHASVEILCKNYGTIGGLWFDGNWSRPQADWKLDRLYSIVRTNQPEAMIINNTGLGAQGRISHQQVDSVTFEQSMPKAPDRRGHKKYISGEMCLTLNSHWGIANLDTNYKSVADVIESLAGSRKVGSNLLLNVGPTPQGKIPDLEAAILKRAGNWVKMHAEPVYDGKTVDAPCRGKDFILEANGDWYYFAHDLAIKGDQHVTLGGNYCGPRTIGNITRPIKEIRWMDNDETLNFVHNPQKGMAAVDFTGYPYGSNLVVRVAKIRF